MTVDAFLDLAERAPGWRCVERGEEVAVVAFTAAAPAGLPMARAGALERAAPRPDRPIGSASR